MIPSGRLTHRYELQRPDKTRNDDTGESVTTWVKVRTFMGSYDQETYSQASRRGQIGGNRQITVICREFDGVDGSMRLLCLSRDSEVLTISSVVEVDGDLEITVEEQVA